MCPDGVSPVDPKLCKECLRPQDAELTKSPLVDDDGVTHEGAVMVPGPYFNKTYAARIVEMADDVLANHIDSIKTKVHEAEAMLDRRRVELSMAQVEQEDRANEQRRKLRSVKVKGLQNVANGDMKKKVATTVDLLVKLAKAGGLELKTPDEISRFAAMLAEASRKSKTPNGGK
jgi:hypothetical protein